MAGVKPTQTEGEEFYRVPTLSVKSDVTTPVTGEKTWTGGTTTRPWTFVNNKTKQLEGVEKRFTLREDTRSIVFVDMTGREGVIKTKHIPKRIVFHNTAAIYKDGVVGFLGAQDGPTAQFFIDRSGQIYQLSDPAVRGQHAGLMNTGAVGIEVEGYPKGHADTDKLVTHKRDDGTTYTTRFFKKDWTNSDQHAAAAWLGEYLLNKYSSIEHVVSHREIGVKEGTGKVDGWMELKAFRDRMGMQGVYGMDNPGDNNADASTKLFNGDTNVFNITGSYFGRKAKSP